MKQELQMRLAVAKFMQESLEAMAVKKSNKASGGGTSSGGNDEDASGAQEVCSLLILLHFGEQPLRNSIYLSHRLQVIDFVEKARQGEHIPKESVMRIAKLFKDELTLANVARPQLVSMCQYMGLQAYGADSFMRFQIRNKLRQLQDDDRRILWEGIDSLNTLELRDACKNKNSVCSPLHLLLLETYFTFLGFQAESEACGRSA